MINILLPGLLRPVIFFLSLVLFAPETLATTASVPGPGVAEGDRSFEYRGDYRPSQSGGPYGFNQRFHYQHALDKSNRWRVVLQNSKTEGRDWDFRFAQFEYQWQYQEPDASGSSSAVRFDLRVSEGSNARHFARIVWTRQFSLFQARTRLNVLVGKDFGGGARSGLSVETRAEMTWPMGKQRVGFQLFDGLNTTDEFGSFDDQNHQIGPIVTGRAGHWNWFASYLAGLSESAPDNAWRFFISRSL